MGYSFDASDDRFPFGSGSGYEGTVAYDRSGMRVPAYALEGVLADSPVVEEDSPESDALFANLIRQRQWIVAQNKMLAQKLADPATRQKYLAVGSRATVAAVKRGPTMSGPGMGWDWPDPVGWVKDQATSAYDAATDVLIGQDIGTQAAARDQAENLQAMVEQRVATGEVTGDRADQLRQLAADNVAMVNEPAKTFVVETAKEAANNASKVGADLTDLGSMTRKVLKYGIPAAAALFLGALVLRG